MKVDAKQLLFRKLKKENCFWSYDLSKMKSISDESLIEHVLLHLDIEDINQLFQLFGYKKVKRVWLDRVAPQGAMFRPYNILYAWYYFGAKRPEAYVKSIETRHINPWHHIRDKCSRQFPSWNASSLLRLLVERHCPCKLRNVKAKTLIS